MCTNYNRKESKAAEDSIIFSNFAEHFYIWTKQTYWNILFYGLQYDRDGMVAAPADSRHRTGT